MQLNEIFKDLNQQHFAGELPLPILRWNPRLRSTAGRFAPGSRTLLLSRRPVIEVAEYLKEIPEGEMHIRDTVLHEMIHYLLWHRRQPYGHTEEFLKIMHRVGAKRYNPVPKLQPIKYWYECLGCRIKVPARRRLGRVACLACCKKYAGGEFSERFLLVIGKAPADAQSVEIPKEEEIFLSASEVIQRLEALKELVRGNSEVSS